MGPSCASDPTQNVCAGLGTSHSSHSPPSWRGSGWPILIRRSTSMALNGETSFHVPLRSIGATPGIRKDLRKTEHSSGAYIVRQLRATSGAARYVPPSTHHAHFARDRLNPLCTDFGILPQSHSHMVLVLVTALPAAAETRCPSAIVSSPKTFPKDSANLKLFGPFYVELPCGNSGWKETPWCSILTIGRSPRSRLASGNACKTMAKLRGIRWNRCCRTTVPHPISVLSILTPPGEVIVCCALGWIIAYDGITTALDTVVSSQPIPTTQGCTILPSESLVQSKPRRGFC